MEMDHEMKTPEEILAEIDRQLIEVQDLNLTVAYALLNLKNFIHTEPEEKCDHTFVIGTENSNVIVKCSACGEIKSKW